MFLQDQNLCYTQKYTYNLRTAAFDLNHFYVQFNCCAKEYIFENKSLYAYQNDIRIAVVINAIIQRVSYTNKYKLSDNQLITHTTVYIMYPYTKSQKWVQKNRIVTGITI